MEHIKISSLKEKKRKREKLDLVSFLTTGYEHKRFLH